MTMGVGGAVRVEPAGEGGRGSGWTRYLPQGQTGYWRWSRNSPARGRCAQAPRVPGVRQAIDGGTGTLIGIGCIRSLTEHLH